MLMLIPVFVHVSKEYKVLHLYSIINNDLWYYVLEDVNAFLSKESILQKSLVFNKNAQMADYGSYKLLSQKGCEILGANCQCGGTQMGPAPAGHIWNRILLEQYE